MENAIQVSNLEELNAYIAHNEAILVYFNTISCNVGEALEPKVKTLLNTSFPKIKMYTADINLSPEISTAFNAFVEPTILVLFDGKETIRKIRNIGIYELEEIIKRPYQLIFE